MRNMTLPAKSFSILLCALLLFAAGCKNDNAPASLKGNVAAPTWAAPAEYDYTSSMTAVIRVDLKAQFPAQAAGWQLQDDDILAAFAGDKCVGVANPIEGLFFLTIVDTEGAITLRYYSGYYKNLFEAKEAFTFVNDARLGTVAEPLVPKFVVLK